MEKHQQAVIRRLERHQNRNNPKRWPLPSSQHHQINRRAIALIPRDPPQQREHVGEVGLGKANRGMGNALQIAALTSHALLFLNVYQIL